MWGAVYHNSVFEVSLVGGVRNKMEDSETEGEDSSIVKWGGPKGSGYEDGEKWSGSPYTEGEREGD